MTTLADLITVSTSSEILEERLADLQSAGFQATSWQSGSVARTLVQLDSEAFADLYQLISNVAAGGLLSLGEDDWLTLYAESAYGEDRISAVNTIGYCELTNAATGIPRTFLPYEVRVGTTGGKRFVNITGGTLAAGGTLDLEFEGESPGSAWNVGNDEIVIMHTTYAGVSVNNPDPGGGSWILTAGSDIESDVLLRERCQDKWPILGYGMTAAAYEFHAKAAGTSTAITRVDVEHTGACEVTVTVAGTAGAVSGADVTIVDNYLEARCPLCVDVITQSATNSSQAVTATLYVDGVGLAAAEAAAEAAIQTLFESLDIGDGVDAGTLYLAGLFEAIMSVDGAVNVTIATPLTDITPGDGFVLTQGVISVTGVAV